MSNSPVFIIGSSRSGTTLLQMIMNSHPNIAMYGEIHFFNEICGVLGGCEKKRKNICDFIDNDLRRAYHVHLLPKLDAVLDKVKDKLSDKSFTGIEFYIALMESFSELESKRRYGEKTNENIRYIAELFSIFPQSRIIHIVRDPRDVVSSMMSMPWASNDILANTLRWRAELSNVRKYKEDDRIFEIRYEDLIQNPEQICRSICDFIGEPFSPQMLEYDRKAKNYIVNEPWKERTGKSLDNAAKQRWKRDLTSWQVCVLQALVGGLMKSYGYKLERYGVAKWLAVPLVVAAEAVKYVVYKIKQRKERKSKGEDIVYGDDRRLYQLLLKSYLPFARR